MDVHGIDLLDHGDVLVRRVEYALAVLPRQSDGSDVYSETD